MELYKYQKEAANRAYVLPKHILLCDCGTGKGQPYGSQISTNNGFVSIEDLKIGDQVCARDGRFYNLTGIFPKDKIDTYRFYYSDGTSSVFDIDHLHICRTNNDRTAHNKGGFSYRHYARWRVLSTKQLINSKLRYGINGKSRNYDIPVVEPIHFEKKNLLIDPYILGLLIGYGRLGPRLMFSTSDDELLHRLRLKLGNQYQVNHISKYDYGITYYYHGKNPLLDYLRNYGLFGLKSEDKFIPNDYLFSSVGDRINILRGLMDTDGHCGSSCEFISASKKLSLGVFELIRSLGGIPKITEKDTHYLKDGIRVKCKKAYRIFFSLKTFNPFKLKRKRCLWNKNPRDNGRWIDKIEYEKEQETICISVNSPDHSYVTNDMIVTHNTAIELAVINHRLGRKIKRCLIAAPKSILWTAWEDDIQKFYPNLRSEIFWHQDMKKRKALIDNFDGDIGIINYEGFFKCYTNLVDAGFDMLVLDESTRIKNHSSGMSKMILAFGATIKYITLMTATPGWIPEHYYTQLILMDVLKGTFKQFRNYFCYSYKMGSIPVWEPKTEKMSELRNLLHENAIRLSKDECLDLPEKTFSVREIFLPATARKQYKTMLEDNVLTLNNDLIIADFPGVLRNKLRQMADGIIYNGNRTHRIHDEKMKELDNLIHITEGQIIIWANYTADVKRIAEKYNALTLYGETKDKNKSINDFKNGKNRIIVCHPASASHGITWTNCNVAIYYNLPDSLEYFLQSQDRIHRIGQDYPCTYYILKAKQTVDDIVWRNLSKREDFQSDLLDYAKTNFKKGDKNAS